MFDRMTLGELLAQHRGSLKTGPFGTVLSASEYVAGGVPVVSVGEIRDGRLEIRADTRRVGADVVRRLPEYVLSAGDLVFARKGAVDRTAWIRPDEAGYFLGSDGIRLRAESGVSSRFLAYQLGTREVRQWLLQHAAGSTLLSMNEPTIRSIPIAVPPLFEQEAIARLLGALDDKIAGNDRVREQVDSLLSTRFRQFAEGATNVPLSDVAVVNAESVKPGVGTIPYLDIASVAIGTYNYPEHVEWSDAPSRARRRIRSGDTVWSTVRPNRRSHALVMDDDLIGSTGLAVLTTKAGQPAGLYEATKRPEFETYLVAVAKGSAYPAVKTSDFEHAPIPNLTSEEWVAFELLAGPLRSRAHTAALESRALVNMRDALLPLLMSGKLRVKDAEREVEAVL